MKKWLNNEFESSSSTTNEFKLFSRDFKREIKKQLKGTDLEIVDYDRGHFYISCFLKNSTNKYIYFSTSDVRSFHDNWYNNILIRTAENEKDYGGGINDFCTLPDLINKAIKLLN